MKKLTNIALYLLTVLCLSACQSAVRDEPIPPTLTESAPISIGVNSMGASGNADPMDKFENGDEIALFMILRENNDAYTKFEAYNYKYGYAQPTWTPSSLDKQLMWPQETKPIYIYGIHPSQNPAGAVTTITAQGGDVRAQFNLLKDQTNINLKKYDLMRSENKGNSNEGLSREVIGSATVPMSFKHKLCKIQFAFVVTKDYITSIPTGIVTIKQIKFEGTQIALATNMGLKNGDLKTEFSDLNSVEWNGSKDLTLSNSYNDTKTVVTDMLLIPFEPVEGLNTLSFTFTYNDGNADVTKVLSTKIKRASSPTDILFAENQYNKVKITANMTDSKLGISADIVDWNTEDHEIEPL